MELETSALVLQNSLFGIGTFNIFTYSFATGPYSESSQFKYF